MGEVALQNGRGSNGRGRVQLHRIHRNTHTQREIYTCICMLHQVNERICGSTHLKGNESYLSLPSKSGHSHLAKHLVVVVWDGGRKFTSFFLYFL